MIAHDAGIRALFVELIVATGKRPATNKACEWIKRWVNGAGNRKGEQPWHTYALFIFKPVGREAAQSQIVACSWKSYFGILRPRLSENVISHSSLCSMIWYLAVNYVTCDLTCKHTNFLRSYTWDTWNVWNVCHLEY